MTFIPNNTPQQQNIEKFIEVTSSSRAQAENFLNQNNQNVQEAIDAFFESSEYQNENKRQNPLQLLNNHINLMNKFYKEKRYQYQVNQNKIKQLFRVMNQARQQDDQGNITNDQNQREPEEQQIITNPNEIEREVPRPTIFVPSKPLTPENEIFIPQPNQNEPNFNAPNHQFYFPHHPPNVFQNQFASNQFNPLMNNQPQGPNFGAQNQPQFYPNGFNNQFQPQPQLNQNENEKNKQVKSFFTGANKQVKFQETMNVSFDIANKYISAADGDYEKAVQQYQDDQTNMNVQTQLKTYQNIEKFIEVTSSSRAQAENFLNQNNQNVQEAIDAFFEGEPQNEIIIPQPNQNEPNFNAPFAPNHQFYFPHHPPNVFQNQFAQNQFNPLMNNQFGPNFGAQNQPQFYPNGFNNQFQPQPQFQPRLPGIPPMFQPAQFVQPVQFAPGLPFQHANFDAQNQFQLFNEQQPFINQAQHQFVPQPTFQQVIPNQDRQQDDQANITNNQNQEPEVQQIIQVIPKPNEKEKESEPVPRQTTPKKIFVPVKPLTPQNESNEIQFTNKEKQILKFIDTQSVKFQKEMKTDKQTAQKYLEDANYDYSTAVEQFQEDQNQEESNQDYNNEKVFEPIQYVQTNKKKKKSKQKQYQNQNQYQNQQHQSINYQQQQNYGNYQYYTNNTVQQRQQQQYITYHQPYNNQNGNIQFNNYPQKQYAPQQFANQHNFAQNQHSQFAQPSYTPLQYQQ
ncbi:UBA-like_superfamily [Hexamita inflata]|uniref:UBA-like superfamily n=1 Tax=Hexamita inflata TaxID=28002 RepID=A0AA86R006_9EUKA|nr:UBA-like superfamily [Hexamita inflata]